MSLSQPDIVAMLRALRTDHPAAEVKTKHILLDDQQAVFRATIRVPNGGMSTGHGSALADERDDYIERAELKALTRALGVLGYVASEHEAPAVVEPTELDVVAAAAPAPAPQPRPDVRPVEIDTDIREIDEQRPAQRSRQQAEEPRNDASAPSPTPMPTRTTSERRPPAGSSRPTPVEINSARDRSAQSPTPFPSQSTASNASRSSAPAANAADAMDQPPLEDYSWTAFWKWAREQGYESKGGIEAFIGRQMNNLSPAEVRQMIVAMRGN